MKPTSFSASINARAKLVKGDYVIISAPRTSHFGSNIPVQIRVTTVDPNAIKLEGSPESVESFDTTGFIVTKVNGEWEGFSSGGDQDAPGFYNNPQFVLTVQEKTQVEVVLQRLSDHWFPMAFFVILSNHGERITKKEILQKTSSVIGKVAFTSGIPDTVSSKYVLLPGKYIILAASKVEGRQGFFTLSVKSSTKVELKPAAKLEYNKYTLERGFIGGKYGIRISDKHFYLNPVFHVYVNSTSHVFLCASPAVVESKVVEFPQTFTDSFTIKTTKLATKKRISICIYVFKPETAMHEDNLICSSGIGDWKHVCCSSILESSSKPYQVVVACHERKEGSFTLVVGSKPKLEIEEFKNVTEYYEEPTACVKDFRGEWSGIFAGGPPGGNKLWIYNPKYSISITKMTKLVITMRRETQSNLCGIGFCVLRSVAALKNRLNDDDIVVICDSFSEISATKICSRVILQPQQAAYILMFYSNVALRDGSFSFTIASDTNIQAMLMPNKSVIRKEFNASWSSGTRGGGSFESPCFRNNPQWSVKVLQPVDIVLELEQALLPVVLGTEIKNMQQMKQEERMERIQQLLGIESETRNDTRYLSIALFLIRPPSSIGDIRLFPDKITADHVYAQSGWKFHSKASISVTLEPSEMPYFIIPSTMSVGQSNQFKLTVSSSSAVEITPVEGTVYEGFKLTKDFKEQVFDDAWYGLCAAGSPKDSPNWLDNPTYMLTVPSILKCRIELKRRCDYAFYMGIVVFQPKSGSFCSSDLSENFVFAEAYSSEAYATDLSLQMQLQPSAVPYRVVIFGQEGVEDHFSLKFFTDIPLSIEKCKVEPNIPIASTIEGAWGGNNALDPSHNSFVYNPQVLLTVQQQQDIVIYLDNPECKQCALYVYHATAQGI